MCKLYEMVFKSAAGEISKSVSGVAGAFRVAALQGISNSQLTAVDDILT